MQLGNVFRDKGVFDSAYNFYRQAETTLRQKPNTFYQSSIKTNKGRYYLILGKPDSALIETKEALRLRESMNDPSMLPDVWILLGNCYREKANLGEAERFYNLALKAAPKTSTVHTQYLVAMGEVYFIRGDFRKALENWTQVLDSHRKLNYKYELAKLLYRMGEGFLTQGYYDLANEYLLRGLDICEKASYQFLKGKILHQITWVNFRIKNYETSLSNSLMTEKIFLKSNSQFDLAACWDVRGLIYRKLVKYDSSFFYHKKGLEGRQKTGNKVEISASLFNIGEFFLLTNQLGKALPYYSESLLIDRSIGDKYGQSLNFNRIGSIYLQQDVLDSAKVYLDKSMELAIPTSAMEIMRDNYLDFASYLVKTGKPMEAIQFYKKHSSVTDSIFAKQTAESISSYRTLYDVDRQQKQLELLNKDVQINREQVQKQRIILYAVLIVIVLLSALTVFYFRFSGRLKGLNVSLAEKNEEIQVQSEEIAESNMALSILNQDLEKSNENLTEALKNLQKTQEQLIQSEKMASLGVLSSGVAHELNNPLNFIKGGVNALGIQLQNLDGDKQREVKTYIDIINEGVNRASVILKGLNHFSRQADHQNERCDIHKILDNCLVILNNNLKHKVVIEKDYSVDLVVITGNEGKLHQAFLNILSNAEQAITDEGTITIKTRASGSAISVSIADTGCGISKENLVKISDPFFTTKAPGVGTGLGLSIAYKIIETHGGKISVLSEQNIGTEFLISLPLA